MVRDQRMDLIIGGVNFEGNNLIETEGLRVQLDKQSVGSKEE